MLQKSAYKASSQNGFRKIRDADNNYNIQGDSYIYKIQYAVLLLRNMHSLNSDVENPKSFDEYIPTTSPQADLIAQRMTGW